jgi:SAM-dependent methyltransferase
MRLTPDGIDIELVCPRCRTILAESLECLACSECGATYPASPPRRVPRLVLDGPKKVSIDFIVSDAQQTAPPTTLDALVPNASPEVDWAGFRPTKHLDPRLMSYIQRPSAPRSPALDLGCGRAEGRTALERAGYTWVGIDLEPGHATVVGDAQALPFADDTFDLVLSLAVLEHVQHPTLFAQEAFRVLRPGRLLVGTVAFLEPLHGGSYYHHTHRGLWSTLTTAGFDMRLIAADPKWTVLRAQSRMGLFPQMPQWLATAIVTPLQMAHLMWWSLAARRHPDASLAHRLSRTAGSIHFVARKPVHSSGASDDGPRTL